MADVRKNQAKLTPREWQAFIEAINAMHRRRAAAPSYREFVRVHLRSMSHAGHEWGVHSMPGMLGRNFLAWHRHYLRQFELRLQRENPDVTIPYWDWIADRRIPRALNRRELLRGWGIERFWSRDFLPERADLNAAIRRAKFPPFQRLLEQVHNNVHLAVGGQMATAESPADPSSGSITPTSIGSGPAGRSVIRGSGHGIPASACNRGRCLATASQAC